MTITETPEARPLPLGIRHLPDEHIACAGCGTPCGPDRPRTSFDVMGRADRVRGLREINGRVTFATCVACAALDAHAARTLDAHPAIRQAIGSPNITRHRIVSAFRGLAVLGVEPAETYTHDALASLLQRLSAPGASASWSQRFAPIWEEGASTKTAAAEPWLHVSIELRSEVRRQYLDHLADALPPRPVLCPTRGCAWCGVGSVMAKRTAEPWTPLTANGASGHLCPTCERYDATGQDMRAALLDYADPGRKFRRRRPYPPEPHGAQPWSRVPGRPNAEPWAHIDLDGLRDQLANGDW